MQEVCQKEKTAVNGPYLLFIKSYGNEKKTRSLHVMEKSVPLVHKCNGTDVSYAICIQEV